MRIKINLTVLLLSVFILAQAQTKNFIDQPYIEVSGSADTLVTPNEIYIQILISERDTKNRISLEDLENNMVNGLKSLGIDTEKDLTASDIASNFRFYLLKNKDILKSKEYELKVKNATTAMRVFMKLEDLGISNASIDRADHSEYDMIKNMMRSKAIKNAKEKATALTKPLNQVAGPAIFISDNESSGSFLSGKVAGLQIRGVASLKEDRQLPNIEFKKMKVEATISAKFTLWPYEMNFSNFYNDGTENVPEYRDNGKTLDSLKKIFGFKNVEYHKWGDDDKSDSCLTLQFINSDHLPKPEDPDLYALKFDQIAQSIKGSLKHPEKYNSYKIVFVQKEDMLGMPIKIHSGGAKVKSSDLK